MTLREILDEAFELQRQKTVMEHAANTTRGFVGFECSHLFCCSTQCVPIWKAFRASNVENEHKAVLGGVLVEGIVGM